MKIEVAKVSPAGSVYEGEEAGSALGLEEDPFARAAGPVRYRLEAQVVSGQLVVRGEVRSTVALLCVRCGEFFSTSVKVSSFLRAYPSVKAGDVVDVSSDIREDVLLELPSYAVCSWEGDGVCPYSGINVREMPWGHGPPGDDRWDALDEWGDR